MRKVTYYCDRCGKLIERDMVRLRSVFIDAATDIVTEEEDGAELCFDCYSFVDDATATAVMNKPAQKVEKPVEAPAEKPKKVPHNKVEIDMPKVFALRKAGWSYEKIGLEFHVSDQTIINHINAWNKEHEQEVS